MTRQLWAPWRLEYVQSAADGSAEPGGCFLCRALHEPDEAALVVQRGDTAIVLLNRYPYATGHLLVAPRRHIGAFGDLTDAEALELHRLAAAGMAALAAVFSPDGYNLGWNVGRVAGAGRAGGPSKRPERGAHRPGAGPAAAGGRAGTRPGSGLAARTRCNARAKRWIQA